MRRSQGATSLLTVKLSGALSSLVSPTRGPLETVPATRLSLHKVSPEQLIRLAERGRPLPFRCRSRKCDLSSIPWAPLFSVLILIL